MLDSDASGYGIGGVLSYVINGTARFVGYYNPILSKPEQNSCMTRRKNHKGQLARWIKRLQTYDFSIEYRRADALLQRPCNLDGTHCMIAVKKECIVDVGLT